MPDDEVTGRVRRSKPARFRSTLPFTVTFAPKEEAFDFEKVQKFVEKICKKLQNEFNIELRG